MRNIRDYAGLALSAGLLAGCGTTSRFVDQPRLTVDEPRKDLHETLGELFNVALPYSVKLCEADPASKECKADDKGISARGVGGLFLPLTLHVTGMDVKRQNETPDGLAFDASLDAKVDAISPMCGTVGGRIVSRDNNTASVQLRNFYCNWALVGNVIVNADLSIDSIKVREKVVTGFYKLTFHGTGNASGSGYYKAVITPKST